MTEKRYTSPARDKLTVFLGKARVDVADFAAAIGASDRSVYRWVAGDGRPGLAAAFMIEAWTAGAVEARDWLEPLEIVQARGMR